MATIDVFTYNGERDILDLHLQILDPHVDKFIIVEAKTTFSGKPKPLYFSRHEHLFKKFWRKMDYFIINERYTPEEVLLAESSPNTQGAAHWKNEFLQKESIVKALAHHGLKNTDRVYIGDVDEIWEPYNGEDPAKLKLRVYTYYLNNRSNEEFWGTFTAFYGDIKGECLNHLRSDTSLRTDEYFGWHFTSMGGTKEVRRKLDASYTAESYLTPWVSANLSKNIEGRKDFLGRPFSFSLDESEWPRYLSSKKPNYEHLCLAR